MFDKNFDWSVWFASTKFEYFVVYMQ